VMGTLFVVFDLPWTTGKPMAWDVKVTGTYANANTVTTPGAAATQRHRRRQTSMAN